MSIRRFFVAAKDAEPPFSSRMSRQALRLASDQCGTGGARRSDDLRDPRLVRRDPLKLPDGAPQRRFREIKFPSRSFVNARRLRLAKHYSYRTPL